MLEVEASAGPGMKAKTGLCVIVKLSVESVAIKAGAPAWVEFSTNVTTPFASDGPEATEIESCVVRLEVKVTVFPATGISLASFKVTVTVIGAIPLATTDAGEKPTDE